MVYDFKKTKYFKYLANNMDLMKKQRVEFNKKILPLLNSQTDELGLILKCHLIIEHYIDEFLVIAYPTIKSLTRIRLTFNQKLELINNPHTEIGMLYPSIKCLNALRNKFSHKLAYKIKTEDLNEIHALMTIWFTAAGNPIPEGQRLLEEFTLWICSSLDSMTQGINKHSPKLGLTGYLEWLKKMTKIDINEKK